MAGDDLKLRIPVLGMVKAISAESFRVTKQLSPGESSHFSFSLRRVKPCECRISAICAYSVENR